MIRMGVTLERVQNKFACIIGELCSEPVVLSQFAIWLDLRLAEYKAKGAISLECSGEHPDPSWLQGHIPVPAHPQIPPARIKQRVTTPVRSSLLSHRKNHKPSKIISPTSQVATSSDIIVVKEEPIDYVDEVSIFPVSLHKHDNWRKRTATETAVSEEELLESDNGLMHNTSLSSSTPKVRRVDRVPSISLEPVSQETESLISIIAGESQIENFKSDHLVDTINQDSQLDQSEDNSILMPLALPSTSSADSDTLAQFPDLEGPDTSNADSLTQIDYESGSLFTSVREEEEELDDIQILGTSKFQETGKDFSKYMSFRTWTEEDMLKAIEAVKTGKMTNADACRKFYIPRSTMRERILCKTKRSRRKVTPAKPRLWSESDIAEAIAAVRSGKMSKKEASEAFNVPRSTLHDRLGNHQ